MLDNVGNLLNNGILINRYTMNNFSSFTIFILCNLVILHAFLSSAEFFFSKLTFSKYSFGNTIGVSNTVDPDQARLLVLLSDLIWV